MTTKIKSINVRESTRRFLNAQKDPATGLIQSYRGSSNYVQDPGTHEFIKRDIGYLDRQCFTYDAALTVIAYSLLGDMESAESILRILEPNFHIPKGDNIGLLNSYRTDGLADGVRQLIMGIDGDRIHTGPNLWVGLAAYHFGLLSGNGKYIELSAEIMKWAMHRVKHQATANQRRGGVSMGSGWGPDWQRTFSTEHNLDYLALLHILEAAASNPIFEEGMCRSALRAVEIEEERVGLHDWMIENVFDAERGLFHIGINQTGLDRTYALDTVSFGILGCGVLSLQRIGVDPDRLIENAERHLKITIKVGAKKIEGFDFTDETGYGGRRSPLIWVEGTYQMALAYNEMAAFYQSEQILDKAAGYAKKGKRLLSQMETLIRLLTPTSNTPSYTSLVPKETEIRNTFRDDWEIQRGNDERTVESVASAVWRLMAQEGFNPMSASPWIKRR